MITVSLCMIVKNEEAVLDRCLSSLAGLMDEIIIVDTGSSDRTIEIARKYTDHIFSFPWTGSFADARNFSFSKASMEYIYCADADEVLDETNRKRFRFLKEGLLPEIDIVQMYYCNQLSHNTVYNYDREYRPKLYKRLRTFSWTNPIHEMVRLDPVIYESDIEILHMPDSTHTSRDISAFEKLCRDGLSLNRHLHNMYARELFISGSSTDFINAIPFFAASVLDHIRSSDELLEAYCVLARAYRLQDDVSHFFKYALKAATSEGCSEICYELGCYYQSNTDYQEAIIWLSHAIYQTQAILDIRTGDEFPKQKLSQCQKALGIEPKDN